MNAADMGWWKADLTTLNYECSEYISELLGLDDSGIISFEDFNKRKSFKSFSLLANALQQFILLVSSRCRK